MRYDSRTAASRPLWLEAARTRAPRGDLDPIVGDLKPSASSSASPSNAGCRPTSPRFGEVAEILKELGGEAVRESRIVNHDRLHGSA